MLSVLRRGSRGRRSPTRHLPVRGAAGSAELASPEAAGRLGVDAELLAHLVGRHGGESVAVIALLKADADLARPLVPGLPYVRAEAVYAVRHEMARTLDDVLSRRTRALLRARDATAEVAEEVARLIAPELGWDEAELASQAAALRQAVAHERESGQLPVTALPGAGGRA